MMWAETSLLERGHIIQDVYEGLNLPRWSEAKSRQMRDMHEMLSRPSKVLKVILVAMRLGVTPVPIPNTMVKT